MRYSFAVLCFVCVSAGARSQDTILKRNAEIVIAKVIEITPGEIKYKKYDFQDGPTYTVLKSDIEMIRYKGGLSEKFEVPVAIEQPADPKYYPEQPQYSNDIATFGTRYVYKGVKMSENSMQGILLQTKDVKIAGLVKQSRQAHGMQFIGFAAIPLGIAGLYCLEMSQQGTYNYSTGVTSYPQKQTYLTAAIFCGAVGIACPVEAVLSKFKRNDYNSEAIRLYNEKY